MFLSISCTSSNESFIIKWFVLFMIQRLHGLYKIRATFEGYLYHPYPWETFTIHIIVVKLEGFTILIFEQMWGAIAWILFKDVTFCFQLRCNISLYCFPIKKWKHIIWRMGHSAVKWTLPRSLHKLPPIKRYFFPMMIEDENRSVSNTYFH